MIELRSLSSVGGVLIRFTKWSSTRHADDATEPLI